MNLVKTKLFTAVATVGLLWLGQPVLAQSNCKEAKGILDEVFLPAVNSASGTLHNAGWLNGTTLVVFGSTPTSFPLPNIAVFTGQGTITTSQGQLKTSNVYLLDFARQQGSYLANIDPNSSTGVFAGATGTLFLNTTTANVTANPQTFQSEVHGQVCFAK